MHAKDDNGLQFERRDFLRAAAALPAVAAIEPISVNNPADFKSYQSKRRNALWQLLGDLPERREPRASLRKTEKHDGFSLEHLELDLNGLQPAPALLLIPDRIEKSAPGILYIHWHGGDYFVGKNELIQGTRSLAPYAPVFAEKGIVALAIDSWCFGERAPYPDDGPRGEGDTFKEMLWKGQVLFGMMMFDEWQALNYLCSRPEVDATRVGAFGISMGSTKAWWLAALDERIACCIDLCCLTDFDSLVADKGLYRHGIYYYVPNLLKHFNTSAINELIVPRPHLSLNGRQDGLTPPAGVERVRDHLLPFYRKFGREEDCRIELFDCGHVELPEMRALALGWLDKYLCKVG
jgi:hypothetical protein